MTRINTIDVTAMTNNQLFAEYREAPRVINKVAAGKLYRNIPLDYRMGRGHESFFGNKLTYIDKRHQAIRAELERRRELCPDIFKSEYIIDTTAMYTRCKVLFPDLCNDWTPTADDHCINIDRLIERQHLQTKADKYCGRAINPDNLFNDWFPVLFNFHRDDSISIKARTANSYWSFQKSS